MSGVSLPEMGVCLPLYMSAGVFREVWKEEAEKAETVQEGEWGMKEEKSLDMHFLRRIVWIISE